MSALIYADLLAASLLPVQEMHPFVLEAHAHHRLAGNESRKSQITVADGSTCEQLPAQLQKDANMKQILKQDPCFSP